ncbi:MAG: translation initiation factor IF-2 [Anaerolineae bacterium]|nr:translation initiation factor IF-2 [Anaerolineae bacterium]MDW8101352.1 translation initiation factor IF-2 [Anaerolineae bacterium]
MPVDEKIRKKGRKFPKKGFAGKKFKPKPRPKVILEEEPAPPEPPPSKKIVIPDSITVRELAQLMNISPIDVIKELMKNGVMANINQRLDRDTAVIVAEELGFTVEEPAPPPVEELPPAPKTIRQLIYEGEPPEKMVPRPPVVTVLGHVDHGKTTLLDAIRHTNVAAGEVGGITQKIGAYQVDVNGKKITFIDTPGHEAFTAMRARGAQVTDIAVLVVAADDGVMPQTLEAIDHARAAQVPIIVAINKIDKPEANVERVKRQLAEVGLIPEEWGGNTICVPISAKKGIGIDELLENILLVAELEGLKANPNRPAVGTVIEGKMDERRGPVATVLVQNGSLRRGEIIVVDDIYGRVRAMFNDRGEPINEAPPSTPALVLGLPEVPPAGALFEVVRNEKEAKAIVEKRRAEKAVPKPAPQVITLEALHQMMQAGEVKELNVIIKADAYGSLEPIVSSLSKMSTEDLRIKIIHKGTGNVSESDVMLAVASKGLVIGFNVDVDPAARALAENEKVEIRLYQVIYHLLEDVEKALKGLLEPEVKEKILGHAQVRAIFRVAKGQVAGVYVLDGVVVRGARARIIRNGELVYDGKVASLRRFTEDVKEVRQGFECGVGLESFGDFVIGDIIEIYERVKVV